MRVATSTSFFAASRMNTLTTIDGSFAVGGLPDAAGAPPPFFACAKTPEVPRTAIRSKSRSERRIESSSKGGAFPFWVGKLAASHSRQLARFRHLAPQLDLSANGLGSAGALRWG